MKEEQQISKLEELIGKHILTEWDFVKIQDVDAEWKEYTYLGRRREIYLHFDYKNKRCSKNFIEGYDTIDVFDEVDLDAKVYRFMATLSRSKSCYLMALFYENIKFEEIGDKVKITADAYSEDGDFGIREYERKVEYTVPKKVVEGTKEETEEFIKKLNI